MGLLLSFLSLRQSPYCQNSTCVSPMKMDDSLSSWYWGMRRREEWRGAWGGGMQKRERPNGDGEANRGKHRKRYRRKEERKERLMGERRRGRETQERDEGWGTYWGVSYVDWAFTMLCFLCGCVGLGPKPKDGNFYFDSLPIHRAPKHINCR